MHGPQNIQLKGRKIKVRQKENCGSEKLEEGSRRPEEKADLRTRRGAQSPKFIHGHAKPYSSEYMSWAAMLQRCLNPRSRGYKWYGLRGIKVCEKWMKFEGFLEDMGFKPNSKFTLDRIDPNGNYEPTNCKWSTWMEQRVNKRTTIRVGLEPLIDVCRRLGLSYQAMYHHVKKMGRTTEEAIKLIKRQ